MKPRKVDHHKDVHFVVLLQAQKKVDKIMEQGPYFMSRRPIVVKPCKVGFGVYTKVYKCYHIWIQLHGLPIGCWGVDSLSCIASVVWVSKFVDDCTSRQKRLQFARVLVEVDAICPLVYEVMIEMGNAQTFKQSMNFEYRPKFSKASNKVGHICKKGARTVKKGVVRHLS